jgi:CcmD family protein
MTDTTKIMIVILVVWAGIFLYLLKLDREIARLKKERPQPAWNPPKPLLNPDRVREVHRIPADPGKADSK